MKTKSVRLRGAATAIALLAGLAHAQSEAPTSGGNVALTNAMWFDGTTFAPRTVYSVGGRFTKRAPERVDAIHDLSGTYVVPPYAEAHNHNIGLGSGDQDRRSVANYLAAGVFYVKIQGNWPLTADEKRTLGLNRPDGLDVMFAHGSLTATGGHPIGLAELLLRQGYYPGQTLETMRDRYYFTIDSAVDLERKWPALVQQQPDFIKTFLLFSDDFGRRKDDPAVTSKGLDPLLLPAIVAKAHAQGLRVTTHVTNASDFRNAIAAGADEIAHLPATFVPAQLGGPHDEPLMPEDARLAAERGTFVITTFGARSAAGSLTPEERGRMRDGLLQNLAILLRNGARIAIGSDNPADTSAAEAALLLQSGVVDELALLRMWTNATAKAIFPERQIGSLDEGYEASFLVLEGNPLEDWQNARRIRLRFKQGLLLEP